MAMLEIQLQVYFGWQKTPKIYCISNANTMSSFKWESKQLSEPTSLPFVFFVTSSPLNKTVD